MASTLSAEVVGGKSARGMKVTRTISTSSAENGTPITRIKSATAAQETTPRTSVLIAERDFPVDSAAPQASCPSCHSAKLAPTFELHDKLCPFCKEGVFARDLNRYVIS
jgi:hypothetical protein